MKKKLFALLMALIMVLSLAACGGDKGGETTPLPRVTSSSPSPPTPAPPVETRATTSPSS